MLGDREQTEGKGYFHMGPVHYFNPAKSPTTHSVLEGIGFVPAYKI